MIFAFLLACGHDDQIPSKQTGPGSETVETDGCDSENGAISPDAADTVGDGIDQNCDAVDGVDGDGDGVASTQSGGSDCNDEDASVFEGATDVAGNGIDEDCNGADAAPAHVGDLTLKGNAEAEDFCAHYASVQGTLTVKNLSDPDALACLQDVSGDLDLQTSAHELHFPLLQRVGGTFLSFDNRTVASYELPALKEAGGVYMDGYGSQLHDLDLSALEKSGAIQISVGAQGAVVDLDALQTATDNLMITVLFEDVAPGASFENATVKLSSLQTVSGFFVLTDFSNYGSWGMNVEVPALSSVGFLQLSMTEDFSVPSLTRASSQVMLEGPAIYSFPLLQSTPKLFLTGQGGIDAPSLTSAPSVSLGGAPWAGIEGPVLVNMPALASTSALSLANTRLTNLDGLRGLVHATNISLDANLFLQDISGLSFLQEVSSFYATNNSPVTNEEFYRLLENLDIPDLEISNNG